MLCILAMQLRYVVSLHFGLEANVSCRSNIYMPEFGCNAFLAKLLLPCHVCLCQVTRCCPAFFITYEMQEEQDAGFCVSSTVQICPKIGAESASSHCILRLFKSCTSGASACLERGTKQHLDTTVPTRMVCMKKCSTLYWWGCNYWQYMP